MVLSATLLAALVLPPPGAPNPSRASGAPGAPNASRAPAQDAPGAPGAPPPAGAIRGRIDVRRAPSPSAARPTVAELGMPGPREPVDRRRSVVYLETAPQPAFEPPPPGRAVLDQRNETFVPGVLAVTAGSTVVFPNSDRVYHNVFSLSKARRFDLGRYARGQSRSVVFDRAGVVRVFCEIHSHMSAYILVFAHRFFAVTDESGRYRLEGVPPGAYTLALWWDGQVRARRDVRVEPGAPLELDLVVE